MDEVTRKCYFDIKIEGQMSQRITVGLFGNTAPKTVKNFAELCTGVNGKSNTTGNLLTY